MTMLIPRADDIVLIISEGPYFGHEGIVMTIDSKFDYAWILLGLDYHHTRPTILLPFSAFTVIDRPLTKEGDKECN